MVRKSPHQTLDVLSLCQRGVGILCEKGGDVCCLAQGVNHNGHIFISLTSLSSVASMHIYMQHLPYLRKSNALAFFMDLISISFFNNLHLLMNDRKKYNRLLYFFCSTVLLSLLSDLLRSSCTSQQQMIQCQGFLVISHVLEMVQQSTQQLEFPLSILQLDCLQARVFD